jgi:hypothetical protein
MSPKNSYNARMNVGGPLDNTHLYPASREWLTRKSPEYYLGHTTLSSFVHSLQILTKTYKIAHTIEINSFSRYELFEKESLGCCHIVAPFTLQLGI